MFQFFCLKSTEGHELYDFIYKLHDLAFTQKFQLLAAKSLQVCITFFFLNQLLMYTPVLLHTTHFLMFHFFSVVSQKLLLWLLVVYVQIKNS